MAARWHMVGYLQRNKAGRAAAMFDRIHSVDRIELAQALSRLGVAEGRTLRVFYTIDRSTDCSVRIATPVVKEKVGAVVIRLDRRPSLSHGEVCADLRLTTSVDITLTRPMGGRVLQDASRGGSLVPLQPPYSSELAIPSPPGSM